jgi:TolB protein
MYRLILSIFLPIAFVGSVTAQPKDTIFYQDVSWSPDGTKLLMSRLDIEGDIYTYRIYLVNADGSGYRKLTEGPRDIWVSWWRDSFLFLFASTKNGNEDVYIYGIEGAVLTRLTLDSVREYHPDYSPDGSRIALIKKDSIAQITVLNSDGSELTITSDSVQKGNPRWSPDGKKIVYYGNIGSGQDSIYIVDADGKNRVTLCNGVWPSWSPDGKSILFALESNILKINLADSVISKVIDNAYFARYSPDGKKIAFIRQTWKSESGWPATSAVFIANSDGSGEYQVTPK